MPMMIIKNIIKLAATELFAKNAIKPFSLGASTAV
jgi:hypothetical protein